MKVGACRKKKSLEKSNRRRNQAMADVSKRLDGAKVATFTAPDFTTKANTDVPETCILSIGQQGQTKMSQKTLTGTGCQYREDLNLHCSCYFMAMR